MPRAGRWPRVLDRLRLLGWSLSPGSDSGSLSSARLRPPPGARTRPSRNGSSPTSNSATPRRTVVSLIPATCAAARTPPSPSNRASTATANRRCRSFRCGNNTPNRQPSSDRTVSVIAIPHQQAPIAKATPQFFTASVNQTALPQRAGHGALDRTDQPGRAVTDHQQGRAQTTRLEPVEEVVPGVVALVTSHVQADQHGLTGGGDPHAASTGSVREPWCILKCEPSTTVKPSVNHQLGGNVRGDIASVDHPDVGLQVVRLAAVAGRRADVEGEAVKPL
jgi:hypothetical protein